MLDEICKLPIEYRRRGDVSYRQLLRELGYLTNPNQVQVPELAAHLALHPSLIEVWLEYSEDKRTSAGWFFRLAGNAGYEIGQIGPTPSIVIADGALACAEFIQRELSEFSGAAA